MEKFPEAASLLATRDAPITVCAVEPASRAQLERVHSPAYLDAIRDGTLTPKERTKLGLPHHPRLLERSAQETAGTIAAAHAALTDGMAANLAGGTHHAFADRGEGYCVLNDVCVALADLWQTHPTLHAMIVDTDAHQGNGSAALLGAEPRAFTYSIHVGRNYPSRKEPSDWDVPLERYADGATYLAALRASLPTALERAEPDLVFWITGADPYEEDRFGQLTLSEHDLAARDTYVLATLRRERLPVVVLYGGGYHRRGQTGRLHADCIERAAQWFAEGG